MKALYNTLLIGLAILAGNCRSNAQLPVITSFSQNGVLVCSNLAPGSVATVQWASSLSGLWQTNLAGLNAVSVSSNGTITITVPISVELNSYGATFYRVLGQGEFTPQSMPDGWNSWYTCGDAVSETILSNAVVIMKANGLLSVGMKYIIEDEGDFSNRTVQGIPVVDRSKFPDGFPWLASFILTNGFNIGIWAIVTNNVGLSQSNSNNYWFYGAESAGANYFLTNGVTYFKLDAPIGTRSYAGGTNAWPDLVDYNQNVVAPFATNDTFDLSYLQFETILRQSQAPVWFNGSINVIDGDYAPNTTTVLNSWRFTQCTATNSAGQTFAGDLNNAHNELLLWNWIRLAANQTPPPSPRHYPDFDQTYNGCLFPAFERHMFACAEFGSAFQISSLTAFDPTFVYHSFTNELGNPQLKQIRARGTVATLAYVTNGCYIYTKDNLQGGKDVLVENENYAIGTGGVGSGDGSAESLFGRWSELVLTNSYVLSGTNYFYNFWSTNAVLDFNLLGLMGTNCLVTGLCLNGTATAEASGSLPVFVKAAGANLYSISPVQAFPVHPATVSLMGAPWFNFWTTNQAAYPSQQNTEPFITTLTINGNTANTMQLGGAVYFGVNHANAFTCSAGVDTTGMAINSYQKFYLDGSLMATTAVWTAIGQTTNISFAINATNQILEIQDVQLSGQYPGTIQGATLYYTNNGDLRAVSPAPAAVW